MLEEGELRGCRKRGELVRGQIRPSRGRNGLASESADVLHFLLNVVARLVNDHGRNFVVELLMTMSDS